jgi:hypothetical protein
MYMPNKLGLINHGRQIVRDLRRQSAIGAAKAMLSKWSILAIQALFAGTFLFAGACAGSVLFG